MHRRELLTGLSTLFLSSQLAKTTAKLPVCREDTDDPNPQIKREGYQQYAAYLDAKYPHPNLTKIVPFTVKLDLTNSRFFGHWDDEQRARMSRAASLFQSVWSSEEFKTRVISIDSLVWHEDTDDETLHPANITGAALYPKLIAALNVTMPVKLIRTPQDQTAASGLTSTEMEESWAKKASVYDLCNTLSHEYTHYGVTGWSWDEGHAGPVRKYVSYGIGAVTENLAAGFIRCCDDPTH